MFGIKKFKDGSKIKVGKPVNISSLSKDERRVWNLKDVVLKSIGGFPEGYELKLVEIIDFEKKSNFIYGHCEWEKKVITISRMALQYPERFLGTLLHEIAHAKSESTDETKSFEQSLTDLLGLISSSLVSAVDSDPKKVKEAESMDLKGAGYMKCRCMECQSTSFDTNDDLTFVRCKKCGKVYKGGYDELVELNKKFIEENLTQDEINAECVHDVINEGDEKHSFDELSKSKHLPVCGVPMDGTPIEMIDKLIKAGVIGPVSDFVRSYIEKDDSEEVIVPSNTFKNIFTPSIYFVKNKKGKVKLIIVPLPVLKEMGMGVKDLEDMLSFDYGKGLQVSPNFITWTFRNGKVTAASTDQEGMELCVIFKDKANLDPGDEL